MILVKYCLKLRKYNSTDYFTIWYFNMIDYVFLNLNVDFAFFTILFSAVIASVIMMQCLMALKNRIIKFKFVFTVFSIVASLSILFIPTYVFLKMYSDGLGDSDIDRLIRNGYITGDVLNQLSENINIKYDTLEKESKKQIVSVNKVVFISYSDLVIAMKDLKNSEKEEALNKVTSEVENHQLMEVKKSRMEANSLIDDIKNKIHLGD